MGGQEGHQVYGADNELYLYSTDGTYIKTVSDQLDAKFVINNTFNNKGLESLSVDAAQTYVVYSTERPLRSDIDFCSNCLRISINTPTIGANDVTLTELHEFRYDLDVFEDAAVENGLSDMAIYLLGDGELIALFLERSVKEINPISFEFTTRIYSAQIDMTDADDV